MPSTPPTFVPLDHDVDCPVCGHSLGEHVDGKTCQVGGCDCKHPGSLSPDPTKCGGVLSNSADRFGHTRYCLNAKGYKTTHNGNGRCAHHGGATHTGMVTASRERAGEIAVKLSETLAIPLPLQDPAVELLQIGAEVVQWKRVIGEKLNEVQGTMVTTDLQGVEHVRAIIELYERAQDRAITTLTQLARLGLAERVYQLRADQGALLGKAMVGVFLRPEADLSEQQLDTLRGLLREVLVEIAPDLMPDAYEGDIIEAELVEST